MASLKKTIKTKKHLKTYMSEGENYEKDTFEKSEFRKGQVWKWKSS